MPKIKDKPQTTMKEKLLEEQNQLLRAQIAQKEEKELERTKVEKPETGPGDLCEATKITASEAWQLKKVLKKGRSGIEAVVEATPKGYRVRNMGSGHYVVDCTAEDPRSCPLIPNCKSKFTKKYKIYIKKPVHYELTDNPPQKEFHLCEKHAKIFTGKF